MVVIRFSYIIWYNSLSNETHIGKPMNKFITMLFITSVLSGCVMVVDGCEEAYTPVGGASSYGMSEEEFNNTIGKN